MRLAHQIEQYLDGHRTTTVRALSRWLGVSESRCREELTLVMPFGVELTEDGRVYVADDV